MVSPRRLGVYFVEGKGKHLALARHPLRGEEVLEEWREEKDVEAEKA